MRALTTRDLADPQLLHPRKKNLARRNPLSTTKSSPSNMPCQTVTRLARRCGGLALAELPPAYLAPSLHFSLGRTTTTGQCSGFSSTAAVAGHGRDLSKSRGVSAIHRSGPKFRLGASKYPLPTPASPEMAGPRDSTPDHGLWGFFPKGKAALGTPEYDVAHGLCSPAFFFYIYDYFVTI